MWSQLLIVQGGFSTEHFDQPTSWPTPTLCPSATRRPLGRSGSSCDRIASSFDQTHKQKEIGSKSRERRARKKNFKL